MKTMNNYTQEPVYVCIPTTAERRERLQKCIESIHQNAGYPHIIVTYENLKEGFVKPIHRILEGITGLVWCIGDDTILTEPDTLKRLVDVFNSAFPNRDGVVNPNDGIQNGQIITMPLCTSETMKKYTYKGYFLNYADNEMTEILRAENKYAYCPSVNVEHQHWVNGKAKKDQTYEHAGTMWSHDEELYKSRKANNFQPRND